MYKNLKIQLYLVLSGLGLGGANAPLNPPWLRYCSTVYFTNLGKLSWLDFKLKLLFASAPAASKNESRFKST